jgi:antitoxin VapB
MATTRVFRSGNSQAVRIPKEFQIHSKEVQIERRGLEIVLRERPKNLADALALLPATTSDFFKAGRQQPKMQRRRRIF